MLRAVNILVAILLATAMVTARADWVNLTGAETAPNIAEITVLDDRVRVALEVYIGDLVTFEALVPDDWLRTNIPTRPPLNKRLQQFSNDTFQILTDEGKLQAELILAEPRLRKDRTSPFAGMINPMTRQRVPGPPEDKRVLYAELEYPFSGKPKSLTIIPPQDENGVAAVTIGFIAYHKTVPIIDFRYLSQSSTVTLDWKDPWYTKFANPNLKRHHKSALMSFLYVEPREVRHEVLIRVQDLRQWTDLGLGGSATIDSTEQARIKELARAFFATHNPLSIDSAPATPSSTRAEFLNISLTGLQVIEDDAPLDLSTAIMGLILSYPVKHLPQHVTVRWDLFSERVDRIPATAIDPAGPLPSFIEARDPTLEWRNYLRTYEEPQVTPVIVDDGRSFDIPVLSVVLLVIAITAAILAVRPVLMSKAVWTIVSAASVLAAVLLIRVAVINVTNPFAGPPDETASAQILSGVLANVNHAYLEKDPLELRQVLEAVVATEAFPEVQDELDRALAIQVAGGGIARVDAIENLVVKDITELDGQRGFHSLAEWTAKASAGHWGHIHRRTIGFRALVELVDDDGAWKLAGITVVDAKQMN